MFIVEHLNHWRKPDFKIYADKYFKSIDVDEESGKEEAAKISERKHKLCDFEMEKKMLEKEIDNKEKLIDLLLNKMSDQQLHNVLNRDKSSGNS